MDPLKHSFSAWEQASPDAGALRELLAHESVWETQRSDHFVQELVINRNYSGSFLSVFRRDEKPFGFVIYVPQRFPHLYEMHIGFLPGTSAFKVRSTVLKSLLSLFEHTDAEKVAAPCPDWNYKLAKMARMMRRILGLVPGPDFPMHVPGYAFRDGQLYGATVHAVSAQEFNLKGSNA